MNQNKPPASPSSPCVPTEYTDRHGLFSSCGGGLGVSALIEHI